MTKHLLQFDGPMLLTRTEMEMRHFIRVISCILKEATCLKLLDSLVLQARGMPISHRLSRPFKLAFIILPSTEQLPGAILLFPVAARLSR